jgi:hypothetical protein
MMQSRSRRWRGKWSHHLVQPAASFLRVTTVGSRIVKGDQGVQLMSVLVKVSRPPASQNNLRASAAGVREAPRYEIAGRKGLGFGAAI